MSTVKTTIVIICVLVFFTGGGLLLDRSGLFIPAKRAVQSTSVPSGLLNYGPMGKILKQLGLVIAVPNDRTLYSPSDTPEPGINDSFFRKKRYVGTYLFKFNPGGYWAIPSSGAVSPRVIEKGLPVLSVTAAEEDLHGKGKGIVSNFRGRGRLWERLAYVSYFDGGRLLFATGAGIRLHGGVSRGKKEWDQSFRLYFRDEYGADRFKPGLLFDTGSDPVRHLVVHAIMDWQARYTPVLAFDIARRIGCRVPGTRMVRFVLNGRLQGYYYLSEHLNQRQWESHMGHSNFAFYKFRGTNDKETTADYRKLERWAADPKVKMTMEEANKYVDVDNLSRHLFSWMFCGTTDQVQGVAVLDRNRPRPRWYWINWDMDQSFLNSDRRREGRPPWEATSLELAAGFNNEAMQSLVRPALFRRLLAEDPGYRDYFVRLVMDLLNHRLSPAYLESAMDRYRLLPPPVEGGKVSAKEKNRLAKDLAALREYLEHRPTFIREEIRDYFNTGEIVSCRIDAAPVYGYDVDGYPEGPGYQGYYFKGKTITVRLTAPDRAVFSHWLVNGETHSAPELVLAVERDTVIRPVVKNEVGLLEEAAAADSHGRALEWIRTHIPGGSVLVVSGESNLDTASLHNRYNIFMWDYKNLEEKTFENLAAVLDNPYFLVPEVTAYGGDPDVEKDAALLREFKGEMETAAVFGSHAVLRNYYYPRPPKDRKFTIGRIEARRERIVVPAPVVWDPNAVPSETSPTVRIFSRRGKFSINFAAGEHGNVLEIRNTAPDEKGNRWASFGYEANRQGFNMPIPGGKYVHMVIDAAVSPPLVNKKNYFLVSDLAGTWESEKVFFTSPEWRTYVVSKKVRMGSTRLLLGARFSPGSENDAISIRNVKLFISDNPLQSTVTPRILKFKEINR